MSLIWKKIKKHYFPFSCHFTLLMPEKCSFSSWKTEISEIMFASFFESEQYKAVLFSTTTCAPLEGGLWIFIFFFLLRLRCVLHQGSRRSIKIYVQSSEELPENLVG